MNFQNYQVCNLKQVKIANRIVGTIPLKKKVQDKKKNSKVIIVEVVVFVLKDTFRIEDKKIIRNLVVVINEEKNKLVVFIKTCLP